jgi:hypothetical protein
VLGLRRLLLCADSRVASQRQARARADREERGESLARSSPSAVHGCIQPSAFDPGRNRGSQGCYIAQITCGARTGGKRANRRI